MTTIMIVDGSSHLVQVRRDLVAHGHVERGGAEDLSSTSTGSTSEVVHRDTAMLYYTILQYG